MIDNPFATIDRRINRLESLLIEIRDFLANPLAPPNNNPFGDFKWLCDICPNIPPSTLRQWDAAGKIPGSSKFGKRKLYDKQAVTDWLRSLAHQPVESSTIEQACEAQVNRQLSKRGGVPA